MCGITGVLASRTPALADVRKMTDAVQHRGPDDDDVWQDPDAGVALGHRRLAILDLTAAGHQPMQSHSGRFVIVLNGEIYNHHDLRKELESAEGVIRWRVHSDTESLLESSSKCGGLATIERAVGMFAIARWDRKDNRLSLIRDRFGEKPLYYGWSRGAFLFGSELHSLRAYPAFDNEVDRDVVSLYMQFGYVPTPYAIPFTGLYASGWCATPPCHVGHVRFMPSPRSARASSLYFCTSNALLYSPGLPVF